MTIHDKIRDEKLQYDINREAAKISALSSGKIDYEYLTGEEILPPDQKWVIEQAKFTYCLFGKAFEKQTKTIEEQVKKKIKANEDHGNEVIKNVNINRDSVPLDGQKKSLIDLKKNLMNLII